MSTVEFNSTVSSNTAPVTNSGTVTSVTGPTGPGPVKNNQPSAPRGVVKPRSGVPVKPKLNYLYVKRPQQGLNGDTYIYVLGVPEGDTTFTTNSPVNPDKLRKLGFYVAFVGEGFKDQEKDLRSNYSRALASARALVKQLTEEQENPKPKAQRKPKA